jgi:hypothetical protein
MGAEQSQQGGPGQAARKASTETANFDFRGSGGRGWVEVEEEAQDSYSWQQGEEEGGKGSGWGGGPDWRKVEAAGASLEQQLGGRSTSSSARSSACSRYGSS